MRIPNIWVAVALSILIHAAVLWGPLPYEHVRLPGPAGLERGKTSDALAVYLTPRPSPPPQPRRSPARKVGPSATLHAPSRNAAPRLPSTPPVIARNQPAPGSPSPTLSVPPAITPGPAHLSADGDLSSYIEAKRRARAESAPPVLPSEPGTPSVEDDNARTNRIIASNLAPQRELTFGYDPSRSGGAFQIGSISYDSAEFLFYGWNKEVRRKTVQLIEVRKGDNSDIRIAVIRRIIAIIREFEQGDFRWESQRLGHSVTLSARPRDNAQLEDFLMAEFFRQDSGRPQ